MKVGDLVIFRPGVAHEKSTSWFIKYAKNRTCMLVTGYINGYVQLLRPDGTQCSVKPESCEVISECQAEFNNKK